MRTEDGLLVALRAAAPAVRAVRSAERANMVVCSWLGAIGRVDQWVVGGGDSGVGGLSGRNFFAQGLARPNQVSSRCDWPTRRIICVCIVRAASREP